jgi:rhamnosyl/mannosyltransferase
MPVELSRRDYDLLHLHVPNPVGALAYLASIRPRQHALVVTHHSDVVRQAALRRLFQPFMNAVLARADAIIATSPNYLETSPELAPFRDKCVVVPYGLETARFRKTPALEAEARAIRQRYGAPLLLGVGRLVYYKGFEHAIAAMREIDAQLLLVGDGPLREPLERLAAKLGVAGRVHFAGNVHNDQLAPYYHASDLFLFPSIARSEAFGIVQLEAMACGLPVINTALDSGVPFVSRSGETGLTVTPNDPAALAAAARELLAAPERRAELGARARQRVETEFSPARLQAAILEIYRRCSQPAVVPEAAG